MTREEFAAAVEQYADMVFRVAYSVLLRREDAEDAMQETLLKLYQADPAFQSGEHRKAWLIRVAMNESRKLTRWYRRAAPLEELPETAAYDDGEERELFRAVMSLPEKYRAAVYLHYYEGYAVREIAGLTGVKESTVQTRLARARELLKKAWKEA